jgi:uncharacterized membrane protein YkvA (DUF1232 family)
MAVHPLQSEMTYGTRYRAWIRKQLAKGNDGLRFIVRESRILTRILKNPAAPWTAKVVAACSVGYIFSPIQLIPSFIPVIGQLDDLSVLFLGMKLIRRLTPASVLAECEVAPWKFEVNSLRLTSTGRGLPPEAA